MIKKNTPSVKCFSNTKLKHRSIMENLIAQANIQFEKILSYIQGKAQSQQLNQVEKGIFYSLLKLGMTLLMLFFEHKGNGYKGKAYLDSKGIKRPYHSIKHKKYLSIFGKVSIARACYWAKGSHGIYPLDAELNLPSTEYSYVLQEWGSSLGSEEPYEKAANFLKTILEVSLYGSSIETMMQKACSNVSNFYKESPAPDAKSEKEILVATVDGKGVFMKKGQLKEKSFKPQFREMRKLGEKKKAQSDEKKKEVKRGKKKMSTVIGAYTVAPHQRTVESFLTKGKKEENRPHPSNKVIQATMESKEMAIKRLKKEVKKRDPRKAKQSVALVDGEHKLRGLLKAHLPWFTIIIDIYHVMEYLWRGAYIFYREGSTEATNWMNDKLTQLLLGEVAQVIIELKEELKSLNKRKRELLRKVITYLENGKAHMRYDRYLAKGYPIGSGVIEGACKNLVKDRMEQCGMSWTKSGAEAVLNMRSIQINKMTTNYWEYHIAQERKRLYDTLIENGPLKLVA